MEIEPKSEEEKLTQEINDAGTFQELYNILNDKDSMGELIDSDGKTYSSKKIKQIIYAVRSLTKEIEDLPDIKDLRERVRELQKEDISKYLERAEKYDDNPPKPKKPSLKEYWGPGHKRK